MFITKQIPVELQLKIKIEILFTTFYCLQIIFKTPQSVKFLFSTFHFCLFISFFSVKVGGFYGLDFGLGGFVLFCRVL